MNKKNKNTIKWLYDIPGKKRYYILILIIVQSILAVIIRISRSVSPDTGVFVYHLSILLIGIPKSSQIPSPPVISSD